jgi:putative PIN family toxin of toxin-antitoxin system
VFDTNVLLSGIFTRGICEELLDSCLGGEKHSVFASNYILKEFVRQAVKKFRVPIAEAKSAARIIENQVELVEPQTVEPDACSDKDDLPVLGTALAARADCLVTGDRDLLDIGTFRGISIISPRAALGRLN